MLDETRREEALRHLQRGMALERANRIESAAEAYRQAVACNPNLREAHNSLGFYYQRSGLLAKAADSFRTVASLGNDFLAYFNLGYVLVELERYEEALGAFKCCLRLEPDDSATHLELGYIYFSRGEFSEALNHLQLPLRNYPEDWEVHNLLGKCYLGLRRYDDAMVAFGRSLMHANTTEAQAELLDNITTVERHREFRQLGNMKDQLYAREGVVYLGSAQDDGLQMRDVQDYHFTYPDIGTTLQRFLALCQSSRWTFSAVVAADTLSRPLANALGQILRIPVQPINALQNTDRALIVLAVARETELLQLTAEHMPCPMTAFCLGLDWTRHSKLLPDLIGIATHGACSVPWEPELRRLRSDGAPATNVQACIEQATHQIVQAVQETPIDTNLPRQMRYYTRTHRRLNASTAHERSHP
jgi:tetratricopeptide (TPR) repeat protein